MNELVMVSSTEISIPTGNDLARAFRHDGGIDPIIAMIAAEVRAHVPDTSTKKGRDAIASLAYKVSRSKTMLDDAGKSLNEAARAEINTVDAARRKVREQLDALRDEARKPLDDWQTAEDARVTALKARLAALDATRADALCASEHIRAVLAEVEAISLGPDWQEFQGDAAIAKDKAVTELRHNLDVATKREVEAAELEELRAEKARRDEEDRIRRDAEEAAAALADRSKRARAYIVEVGEGRIGGQPQAFGILIYELEQKLPALIDALGDHATEIHALRIKTIEKLKAAQDEQCRRDALKAEADRKAAAEEAERQAVARAAQDKADAEARHQREIEEAAQRERDRIEVERKAEEEARKRREESARIRNRVKREIAGAIEGLTVDQITEALIAGRVPNCKVTF